MNRVETLRTLLQSLVKAEYGREKVNLRAEVDLPPAGRHDVATLALLGCAAAAAAAPVPYVRPPPGNRTFRSVAIDELIDALRPLLDARPDLEDRLVEVYLKHDYACLGYPDPRRHRRST